MGILVQCKTTKNKKAKEEAKVQSYFYCFESYREAQHSQKFSISLQGTKGKRNDSLSCGRGSEWLVACISALHVLS